MGGPEDFFCSGRGRGRGCIRKGISRLCRDMVSYMETRQAAAEEERV